MYDRSDRSTFENLETWRNLFLKHGAPKENDKFPFLIVGNKSDLTEEMLVKESEMPGILLIKEDRLKRILQKGLITDMLEYISNH